MHLFSYVITRDYGFAPNPFYGICTLATCKPEIRKMAKIGDWVIGTGPKPKKLDGKLVYAMKITEKISFTQYWNDERFKIKRPRVGGSLKQTYGDNIYFLNERNEWQQENSHHSCEDGSINLDNLKRDTKSDFVLISYNFHYFGKDCIDISDDLKFDICRNTRQHLHIKDADIVSKFEAWISKFEHGYINDPRQFISFKRYNGKG